MNLLSRVHLLVDASARTYDWLLAAAACTEMDILLQQIAESYLSLDRASLSKLTRGLGKILFSVRRRKAR